MFLLLAFFGALLVGGCMVYSGYNHAVTLDENVKARWAQVENVLQRRFDLIPNLVETVKGVAAQEKDVFVGIAEARKAYTGAQSVAAKAKAASAYESAISRLLMIRESYPELKSNQAFTSLMDSLEGTENRISVERMNYNEAVRALNTYTRKLFGRFCSSLAGVERAEFFEVSEEAKETPKVDFSP
jgi:LemA protein